MAAPQMSKPGEVSATLYRPQLSSTALQQSSPAALQQQQPRPTPLQQQTEAAPASDPAAPARGSFSSYRRPGSFQPPPYRNWQNPDQPEDTFRQNREIALNEGGDLQNQFASDYDYQGALGDFYRPQMDTAYGDLANTPGYTPDESAAINREDQFNRGITSASDYASLLPTAQESASIYGDPNSIRNDFNANQGRMDQAVNQAGLDEYGAYGPASGDMARATQWQQEDYGRALDPSKLSQSGQYQSDINAAVNKGDLSLSPDFAQRYELSPEDQQRLVSQAARTAGNQSQAEQDRIYRSALASGNASPLAIAAATDRARRTGAINTADAVTDARIAANQAAADRLANAEQMRLNANQNYSGLKAQTLTAAEQQRLAAQQFQTQAQMDAASQLGNARRSTAQWQGDTGIGIAQDIGNRNLNNLQYQTDTGTDINRDINAQNQNYGQFMYTNRSNLGQRQQDNTYGQSFQTQQQLSNTNQQAADARRQGQNEYRGWLTGQTQDATTARQNAGQQQLGTYQAKTGAANQSTGGLAQYKSAKASQPGVFEKIAGAATGALGALI